MPMENSPDPRSSSKRFPLRALACASLLTGLIPDPAGAQVGVSPSNLEGVSNWMEFQSPWDGPAAAFFNPAMVAETNRFDLSAGAVATESGKGGAEAYSASVAVFTGIYAGAQWVENGSVIDGSNAIYTESILSPTLAYGWKGIAGSGYSLDLGASFPCQNMNAFGAVSSNMYGLDLGLHLLWPTLPHKLGRFHGGFALHNAFNTGVELPDKSAEYKPEWHGENSIFWEGLGGYVDLFASNAFYGDVDKSERLGEPNRYFWKSAGGEVDLP